MRRLSRFSPLRFRDEERGAVLAIVAISLICLLGMLVLTFDLGRGVALKRNMVNAADAGALAAARECGLAHGEGEARKAAEQLVADNNSAATVTGFEIDQVPQCSGAGSDGERQVTVTVNVGQEYFFAQIFGFNSGTVTATATAEWESGVLNPPPLKLDRLKVDECVADPEGTEAAECWYEFEKAKTGSQRGWLNLPEGWPDPAPAPNPTNCTSSKGGANDLVDYINRMGMPGDPVEGGLMPTLRDPTGGGNPPTYVCAAPAVPNTAIQAMVRWLSAVAKLPPPEPVVYFPVVACDPTVTVPPDASCRNWIKTPGREAYPVVDLMGFYVRGAWQGQAAQQQPNCDFKRGSSDVFCIHLKMVPPDQLGPEGAVRVWLVD
jgi:Flp pilus assembly protein TadG